MPTTTNQSMRLLLKPGTWMAPLPIPHIDQYLLAMRWIVILAVLAITLATGRIAIFGTSGGEDLVKSVVILPLIIGYNLLVSIYIWHRQPLSKGRVGWLLLGDAVQAILATALTGGAWSLFFLLFMLVAVEAAMVFYWQAALALTVSTCLLYMLAGVLDPTSQEVYPTAVTVSKTLGILTVGVIVILSSEQVRREDVARRAAASAAARATALNEISLRLGESGLELERILATVLDTVRTLSETDFSLVLLPTSRNSSDQWRITASNTIRHPVGEQVANPGWIENDRQFFAAGAGCPDPLPGFVADDNIIQLIGVRLTLLAGERPGLLMFGRQTDRPLSDDEQVFLRSMALEVGVALRNASLYAQEQEQVARLRRFDESRATFFSTIAHELKTPLTVLKTLVPSLQQMSELPVETQVEMTEIVEKNLTRLETLITDLLESTRLEADAVTLHRRPTNLVNRVQRVIDNLSPLLARKRQYVILKTAPDLPLVWADGRRVEQILSNLINNAAKFAPPESTVEVELGPVEDAVQVCVADAGSGVPLVQRERIFEKFYIAVTDEALAGTGLGLYICREVVRLHNGRIWVEDRPGGGSRFCFTLPLALKETPFATQKETAGEKSH